MTRILDLYGPRLVTAIYTHFFYVAVSVGIALLFALVCGVLLSRIRRWADWILPALSVFQTIPGIVFIGLLFLAIGMVPATVIIALSVYAFFPILKNTYVGIIEVDEGCKEAARGCGMSSFQILLSVELPLALPAIIGGVRIATVYTVSWAVLASMIGLGGLGDLIYAGVSSNNNALILIGAIPAALMAIALSLFIDLVRLWMIPRALRRGDK